MFLFCVVYNKGFSRTHFAFCRVSQAMKRPKATCPILSWNYLLPKLPLSLVWSHMFDMLENLWPNDLEPFVKPWGVFSKHLHLIALHLDRHGLTPLGRWDFLYKLWKKKLKKKTTKKLGQYLCYMLCFFCFF